MSEEKIEGNRTKAKNPVEEPCLDCVVSETRQRRSWPSYKSTRSYCDCLECSQYMPLAPLAADDVECSEGIVFREGATAFASSGLPSTQQDWIDAAVSVRRSNGRSDSTFLLIFPFCVVHQEVAPGNARDGRTVY